MIPIFKSKLTIDRCVLRLSRKVAELAPVSKKWRDGCILFGDSIKSPIRFKENGIPFEVDVLLGQKTGFFLDQRDNRQYIRLLSKGKSVLNVFSYTGGFSVYAFAGGARSVLEIDSNSIALNGAKKNLKLTFLADTFLSENLNN